MPTYVKQFVVFYVCSERAVKTELKALHFEDFIYVYSCDRIPPLLSYIAFLHAVSSLKVCKLLASTSAAKQFASQAAAGDDDYLSKSLQTVSLLPQDVVGIVAR